MVIIYELVISAESFTYPERTHLIHLLELGADGGEPSHKFVESYFPQIVISLFGGISGRSDCFHVPGSIQELGLSPSVLDQHVEIGFRLSDILCN
jgi:hypothetical protein